MTDNELLQQILAKVNKIDALEESVNAIKEGQVTIVSRVDKMETKMDNMETKMDKMETRMDKMETRMGTMETKMDKMESKMDTMESKTDKMETKMDTMETDLRETRIILESLPHQIKLIAEQHGIIIEKLEALSDYPVTRERVATLEGAIKMVADRVTTLEAV